MTAKEKSERLKEGFQKRRWWIVGGVLLLVIVVILLLAFKPWEVDDQAAAAALVTQEDLEVTNQQVVSLQSGVVGVQREIDELRAGFEVFSNTMAVYLEDLEDLAAQPQALAAAGATATGTVTATTCRSTIWWNEALSSTADVASLVAVLDRDFTLTDGGQWSEPGYAVPADSVFWTDLFQNTTNLPANVEPVRTQGGWGVYFTQVEYVVPPPNGGGRWMRLCQP